MEEIQSELKDIRRILKDVSYQMQELRESIRGTPFPAPMLSVSQPYQHPWWEYQRLGFNPSRNNLGGQIKASGPIDLDQTGSGVSGAT